MYQAAAGITVACAYYAYLLGGYPISTIAQLLNERAHGGGVCVYVRILLHLNYNAADHIVQANGARLQLPIIQNVAGRYMTE